MPPRHDCDEPRLVAYEVRDSEGFELVTAPPGRDWMNATNERFANRCLPLLMANQAGWLILNNCRQSVKWNGGQGKDAVEISCNVSPRPHAVSHFGHGIVTWNIPLLFRTCPGYNLLVRGPANHFKDGIAPLEGLVETDWAPATFTINWKITRIGMWVTFEEGEPLCMVVPQRRGELEAFAPQILPAAADTELLGSYQSWKDSRATFIRDRKDPSTAAAKEGWQKHYFQGRSLDGSIAPEHQTRLRLRSFARSDGE